jgi:hypothetical protein
MYEHFRQVLDAFCTRKQMYLNPVTAEEAEKFLLGFDVGCLSCGVDLEWQQIAERRGWRFGPTSGPIEQMRRKGLSDIAIIDELISFRSEAARQIADHLT